MTRSRYASLALSPVRVRQHRVDVETAWLASTRKEGRKEDGRKGRTDGRTEGAFSLARIASAPPLSVRASIFIS